MKWNIYLQHIPALSSARPIGACCERGRTTESVTKQYFLLQINAISYRFPKHTKQIAIVGEKRRYFIQPMRHAMRRFQCLLPSIHYVPLTF